MASVDVTNDDRSDEAESPWPAFADLLASTTLLFLILFAVVAIPALKASIEGHRREQVLVDVRQQLLRVAQRNHNRVVIASGDGYLIVRIAGDATFPMGAYELPQLRAEGREILAEFATAIRQDTLLLQKIEQIQVVGHTSTEGPDAVNWMLSAQRAVSVATYLIGLGLPACKVTALGRGRYYPVDPALGGATNPDDRRIELEIHPVVLAGPVPREDTRCIERRRLPPV